MLLKEKRYNTTKEKLFADGSQQRHVATVEVPGALLLASRSIWSDEVVIKLLVQLEIGL